jgi:hypothetical protein
MELDMATPLAAAAEHWIADTDVGDAWAQAKENVADLRAQLVADWNARQESHVGETPASLALRKDYDRWLCIHDQLKAFVLDCRADGNLRELPPDLKGHFKNWSELRRKLLRDAPDALAALDADLASMRQAFAALEDGGGSDAERLEAVEMLSEHFVARRAEAAGLKADADAVARRYATDDVVADIAERAGNVDATMQAFGGRLDALRADLQDGETVRDFEARTAAFADAARRLGERTEAQARREEALRTLTGDIASDIQAKTYSRVAEYRARLETLEAESAAARGEDSACARTVKEIAKDFSGTLGPKAVRSLRRNLASEASAARLDALSKDAEAVALRHGKSLDSALVVLQNASFKLEDGAGERAALAEAAKRLARLEAMSRR